jgi:hypothetical protein
MQYGSAMPEALLFSLLWSMGGVVAASFLTRVFSGPPPVAGQGVSYAPTPYGTPPANPYAAGPPTPAPYIPQQAAPPAQPQAPQPRPQPGPQAPPPPSEVHDLGVVQPDRLTKREEPRDEPRDGGGGGRHQ